MASIKSRFDVSSPDLSHLDHNRHPDDDGPWLTTYSRALCSIYPKDEDDCWDAMLSTQSSSIFTRSPPMDSCSSTLKSNIANIPISTTTPTPTPAFDTVVRETVVCPQSNQKLYNSNSTSGGPPLHRRHTTHTTNVASCCSTPARALTTSNSEEDISTAPMLIMSPGRLSHALCSVGFNCIDYFTATQDDTANTSCDSEKKRDRLLSEEERLSSEAAAGDWAAAVCGKRTAALERKRVLSRTSSLEAVNSLNGTQEEIDPWFAALDRLSRWDEVAYR
ncbi:hypothetical protein BG004_001181 [Podila humilis]|nr:hypothetical protein BG004_001181 [Podila humilis]